MIDAPTIERLQRRRDELEAAMASPDGATSTHRIKTIRAEYRQLSDTLTLYHRFDSLRRQIADCRSLLLDNASDADMRALALSESAALEKQLPDAEKELLLALLPPDPIEERNIILEIRAGTGGEEAALFAGVLVRMYSRYAERHGWKISTLDASPSALGGFKEIILSVEGDRVYRDLRYESGVHRVQRVPETEAQGRIHTSAATVAILPEAEDIDEIDIPMEEIRLDLYRASGPGGQKVNKTESAVRLTHLPTGIVVQSQDERSQPRNKEKAMRVLRTRLLDHYREKAAAKTADARRSQIGTGDRSERIRTYNFPQNRITDHRIHLTLYRLDQVVEGDLDELIGVLRDQDMQCRLHVAMDMKTT